MPYKSPVTEFEFILNEVVDFRSVNATERYSEATDDLVSAILTEAGKMSDDVLAPLRRGSDLHPAHLKDDVVHTAPGFGDGYRAISEGGWVGIAADPAFGGMGLPQTLSTAVHEMMAGACLALELVPLMSQGQIEALSHHASDEIKNLYLPKLISGAWSGTMNLSEPQAGSDVGALRTQATPNDDGTFAITGQKVFISWADADFLENVCHLVLARLPGAPAGTKGISLFMVPKYLPDAAGNPGTRNNLNVISLEHKLGLHGSPTAVMQYDGATGWMVGPENGGMAAMFTMMNNARLGVGVQGIGVAEAAFQDALAYAMERKQGRTAGPTGAIIEHADVRRMLALSKARIFAARAIALDCAVSLDMAEATNSGAWRARAAFLTPIAKAFGSDTGIAVSQDGIQVHGGMGFIEETGVAQYLRDVRVTAIYEGTNGIQAMDLVARKLADGGDAAFALLDDIEMLAEAARGHLPELAQSVWSAAETLRDTTEALLSMDDLNHRFAGAADYLQAFALVLGGHYHLKAALSERTPGARTALARTFVCRLLPEHASRLHAASLGADDLFALSPEILGA